MESYQRAQTVNFRVNMWRTCELHGKEERDYRTFPHPCIPIITTMGSVKNTRVTKTPRICIYVLSANFVGSVIQVRDTRDERALTFTACVACDAQPCRESGKHRGKGNDAERGKRPSETRDQQAIRETALCVCSLEFSRVQNIRHWSTRSSRASRNQTRARRAHFRSNFFLLHA